MARKLKVFRTPVGFHDAYVAAPSQTTALKAWGSAANLFARGVAEVVTDPALTAEPLAKPGVVIKRLRGSADDHFEALPKAKARPEVASRRRAKSAKPAKPRKLLPRPSRAKLDAAEQALVAAETRQADAEQKMRQREAVLQRERRALDRAQTAERDKLARAVERARKAYAIALTKWRDAG